MVGFKSDGELKRWVFISVGSFALLSVGRVLVFQRTRIVIILLRQALAGTQVIAERGQLILKFPPSPQLGIFVVASNCEHIGRILFDQDTQQHED